MAQQFNTMEIVVETVEVNFLITHNVKVLCAVGDFVDETFNTAQTFIRSRNLNNPRPPLLHKTRVISWHG